MLAALVAVSGFAELQASGRELPEAAASAAGNAASVEIPDVPPPSKALVPENFVSEPGFFKNGDGVGVDTLDIGDGFLQIVLRDDHTWYYTKNFTKMATASVFTDHWSEVTVNPYTDVKQNDLPYRSSLCLVDSVSSFVCPYMTKVYSPFGYRHGRRHQGVDLPLAMGTPVKAAFDGRVRLSRYVSGYGNLIIVRHENGLETFENSPSRSPCSCCSPCRGRTSRARWARAAGRPCRAGCWRWWARCSCSRCVASVWGALICSWRSSWPIA